MKRGAKLGSRTKLFKKYETVNWDTERDVDIARRLGITRERARQVRNDLNKPKSKNHWKRSTLLKVKEAFYYLSKELQTTETLLTLIPVNSSYGTIQKYLQYFGLTKLADKRHLYPHKKYCWEEINFDLPNILIKQIWGFADNNFANITIATHRRLFNKQKSKFYVWRGQITQKQACIVPPPLEQLREFKQLIDAEKEKVANTIEYCI